jgi:hypothetical protein
MANLNKPTVSIPSIVAIIAAILSFNFGAILGLIFAGVALLFGIIGIVIAISPQKRGGIISISAVGLGVIGVIAAVVKFIMWIF